MILNSRKLNHVLKLFVLIASIDYGIKCSAILSEAADQSLSRCPDKANTTGIYLYSDKKLCNVFHECFCNDGNESICSLVKSNVCPLGKVFHNVTSRCEPIELFGCESLYLQWINSSTEKSVDYDEPITRVKNEIPLEPNNVNGISDFMCPYGSNERFPDPQICNVFHVCVSRGEQTYDQPFLCPFSSVFRVIDSNTMFCDKKNSNDCKDKAFYRSAEDEFFSFTKKSDLFLIEETSNVTDCENNEIYEDELYCNTYHLCKDKKDKHYMCENNLLFNPMSQMCDYPINVVCSFKQIFKKEDIRPQQAQTQPQPLPQALPQLQPKPEAQSHQSPPHNEYNHELHIEPKVKEVDISQSLNPVESVAPRDHTANNILIQRKIFGTKIDLKCPRGAKNYLFPDTHFCNVFHHCDGNQGNIFVCERGQAFDPFANGPEASGVCNFENLVDCEGKYILTETGKKAGQSIKPSYPSISDSFKDNSFKSDMKPIDGLHAREELISGIKFDCRAKSNGHWRDYRYCDVFHACISNEQKKTYSCAQLGERIYFNETTKRCEFLKYNPSACPINAFFNQLPVQQVSNSKTLDEPNESWKYFIRAREQFRCMSSEGSIRVDGFYASRWCNVFYRCFLGIKSEFLCPKMLNSDRLWWVQHSSSQETAQTSAACVWPCETKKQCMSPGGTIVQHDNGSYTESLSETERIWRSSSCGEEKLATNDIFKIGDSSFNCNGLTEGSFYPSKYCNIFHRCTSGKRKDFKCPRATNSPYDLWWNPITSQCDWPCKVKCADSVYGSAKSSFDIRKEDYFLNEEECQRAQYESVDVAPVAPKLDIKRFERKLIDKPYPDDFICPGIGLFVSDKYCNVYYECKNYNKIPQASYYCVDSHFDMNSRTCSDPKLSLCAYKPALTYPLISIEENNLVDEVTCSYKIGSYVLHSNRYCNIYYLCSGRSNKAQAFRCFDKQSLTDGVYSRDFGKCASKFEETCYGELYTAKPKYQSSPISFNRLTDLQPLACRSDQQYLAEHDKYCNLFHSCILGKYQMYACVALGSYDKESFFYYTNGDCAAPSLDQCGPNKSIYPYNKLFPETVQNHLRMLNTSVPNYSSIPLKKSLKSSPKCDKKDEFSVQHNKYCNIYFECKNENLLTYVCVDNVSGNISGVYDSNTNKCKSFNAQDCPSKSLYQLESDDEQEVELTTVENIQTTKKQMVENSFKTDSNFSCLGLKDAYYESEYCNVYYRCVNGKRIDSRCSSGRVFGSNIEYDLWWFNQNSTFNSSIPLEFSGDDSNAQCEFPCKIKCFKKIWTESGHQIWNDIVEKDLELHPECSTIDNRIKNSPEMNQNIEIPSHQSKPDPKFTMTNLKQKIKSIINNRENASYDKIYWNDW